MMDLGQVFTSENVAKYMVSLFGLDSSAEIMDPCFGSGVFLEACLEQNYNNLFGYEIDESLFAEFNKDHPDIVLKNEDFLMVETSKKYDGIIMNPPYIRHEKIDDLYIYGVTKKLLRKNQLFKNLPKTANMYMYFIVKAIDLLKDNGELIVIFPSSWLLSRSGKNFEKMIFSECVLKRKINISGEVFEKEALVDVIILDLIKNKKDLIPEIKTLKVYHDIFSELETESMTASFDFSVNFNDIAKVRRGMTTGFNQMFINPSLNNKDMQSYTVPIISSPKSINGYTTTDAHTDKMFFCPNSQCDSNDVQVYLKFWEGKILKDKSPKSIYEKIKQGNVWYHHNLVNSRGIIFSYFVRNDMKFVDNSNGILVRDNFYIIYPKIDNRLLFALLNNHYTYYQLENIGKKYGAGLLKLQGYDLEDLLFPNIECFTRNDKKRLKQLADELINTGNESLVYKITKEISFHANISYDDILCLYNKIKKQRLEEV